MSELYTMRYGKETLRFALPGADILATIRPNPVELPAGGPAEQVRAALAQPIGAPPLGQIVQPGETVCIVIPDITRSWQSPSVYLPLVVEELSRAGVPDQNIRILCATGSHRRHSRAEHAALVTEDILSRIEVLDHDCRDTANLVHLGDTSRGTPVWLNRQALSCDRLVLTGGATYHFLAGFGGGRKYLLPGIAGHETIMRHHALSLNPGLGSGTHPQVRCGVMDESNPFHADLMEAAALAKPDFLLNVVVGEDGRICRAFAGDWVKAHQAACDLVDAMDGVPIARRARLVVASGCGYPKDMNLYQACKTFFNAAEAAEEGGVILFTARCEEGIGSPECEHILCDFDTMLERERALRADFSIGAYVGFAIAGYAQRFRLIGVSQLPSQKLARAGLTLVPTIEEGVELALQAAGPNPTAILMPDGASTLPKYRW